jgi:hypothetical protein
VELLTDEAIALLAPRIGTRAARAASGVPQAATWYRRHRASPAAARAYRAPGPEAVTVPPPSSSPSRS